MKNRSISSSPFFINENLMFTWFEEENEDKIACFFCTNKLFWYCRYCKKLQIFYIGFIPDAQNFYPYLLFSGLAVINAAGRGISFSLKRRDQMLKFVLKLMGTDDTNDLVDSSVEFLHTQVFIENIIYFSVSFSLIFSFIWTRKSLMKKL